MQHWRRAKTRRQILISLVAVGLIGVAVPNPSANAARSNTTGLMVSRCSFSHRAPSDPIVHPGMSGMSHSHDFFGNTTTNADSTPESMAGQTTTCRTVGDTAAYWVPTLYANNRIVEPVASLAYFQALGDGPVAEMPIDLKMVAGGKANVRWACFDHGMSNAKSNQPRFCAREQFLSVGVKFPECWNGTDLDSVDHRSHMAYATPDNICPTTHPVKVPRLTFWVLYERTPRRATLSLASGAIDTAHADFFNTADPATQTILHDYCISGKRICYKTMYRVLKKLGLERNGTTKLSN